MNSFERRPRFIISILMIFAVVTAALLFLPQSLRLDESQTLWQVSRFPSEIIVTIGRDVHVPLYHFALYAWDIFFGGGMTANRIFSLLFFLLSIPLVVLVGDEAYGSRKISLFAAVLFTLSPFMNWYASEIRMYSMLVFAMLVNQYYFIRLRKTGKGSAWTGYTLSAIGGVYIHYFFGLVLLAQGLFYLFAKEAFPRGSFKKIAITFILVLLSLAPWVWYVYHLGQAVNAAPVLPRPALIDIFNTFSSFLIGEQSIPINSFLVALWPLIMVLWFLSFQKKADKGVDHKYLLFSLFIPIAVTYAVSIFYRPVYLDRYLIFTLPAFYLILAAILDAYPPRLAAAMQAGFVILAVVMLTVESVSIATPVKEDYRAAAQYFTAYATPQDVIAITAPFTIYPVEYYYQGPAMAYTLPLWNQGAKGAIPSFSEGALPSEVQQIAGSHARLWLLESYDQGYQSSVQNYFDGHYKRLASITLSQGMTLDLYQLRYDVSSTAAMPIPATAQP